MVIILETTSRLNRLQLVLKLTEMMAVMVELRDLRMSIWLQHQLFNKNTTLSPLDQVVLVLAQKLLMRLLLMPKHIIMGHIRSSWLETLPKTFSQQ